MTNNGPEVEDPLGSPIDPRQVDRISAVHGGFLYQHLYGVALLLVTIRRDNATLVVERDEDLEAIVGDQRFYIQVKTRNRALQPADISESMRGFEIIRGEHGLSRTGTPFFRIVSNSEPGPALRRSIAAPDWPRDVEIVYPDSTPQSLPPALPSIEAAFEWCVSQAKTIPFGSLSPETLVWKLAATILHAATGARDRQFKAADMPQLLEQLLVQLQDFPDPPQNYRPQIDEPPLVADERLRIVIGFSGAGKTAWASQAALHCSNPIAYLDVLDIPTASLPTNIARELTARFLGGRTSSIGGAAFAEENSLNVLRASARQLQENGISVHIILDNAHRLDASTVRALVDAAPNLKFLCLAQPWPDSANLEARYGIAIERLAGWSHDEIAAEFRTANTEVSIETAIRIRKLTGGLPLYVRNAALVATRDFSKDVEAFCASVEARTHDQAIAQEIILEETFRNLNDIELKVAGLLSFSDIPLAREEILTLANPDIRTTDIAATLRNLRRASILVTFQGDRSGLHDATRPMAIDARKLLTEDQQLEAQRRLVDILITSLRRSRDVSRLSFLLRLLPRVGLVDALVTLAGDEMFHEQGDPRTLRAELETVANDQSGTPRDRFWAHDALAYWESRDGGQPDLQRLTHMKTLVRVGALGISEQMNLHFKELAYWGAEGDRKRVEAVFSEASRLGSQEMKRLLRYNYAVALYRLGALAAAQRLLNSLINEYFSLVGVSEGVTLGKTNQELHELLPKATDTDVIKRLADCLAFWAIVVQRMGYSPVLQIPGEPPRLRRITALKFYALVPAARSVVSTGQEAVDDFLTTMADPVGARQVMETHVLPVLREGQLTDMIIPIRSHYAIVLAFNNEVAAARREMVALSQYAATAEQRQMITERSQAIDEIADGRRWLERRIPPPVVEGASLIAAGQKKVGRNEKCPCGSGLKFKKCCGQNR